MANANVGEIRMAYRNPNNNFLNIDAEIYVDGEWLRLEPYEPKPKDAQYYKTHCGPWLATMQVDMGSGDYYYWVEGNLVSMMKSECAIQNLYNRQPGEEGELSIFKKHRQWLMDEYGISCAKYV